jgi:nucleolar pre-ribosomal-associated protein 1
MRERTQIKVLTTALRNAATTENEIPRIPKVIAIFLGEALQVMMDPKHFLYEKVNVFFLQRPTFDLDDIPMFYSLSNAGEHFERAVLWLLDILIAGADDEAVTPFLEKRSHRSWENL